MDESLRLKFIEMVSNGRASRGTTFKEIAEYLGITVDEASEVWHDHKLELARERYYRNLEKLRAAGRWYQQQTMYVRGVRVPGIRRDKSILCEVCGGNNQSSDMLYYHHWDNADLSRGVWVCPSCHQICERTDGYHGDRIDLQAKYIELKGDINNHSI